MARVTVDQRVKGKGKPWRARWRDKTGAQVQRTFARKADAQAFASSIENELRTGAYVAPRVRRTTFGVQYDVWRAGRRVSETRHKTEDSLAKNHVLPRWGKVPLEDIDFDGLQTWINELRDRYSWETTAAIRQLVRSVLASAMRSHRLSHNPCAGVVVSEQKRRNVTADSVLQPGEIDRLVAAAPERWWTFLYCCAWLGFRLSEGLAIERRDIDLQAGTLTIRGTKTDAAERTLPLPEPAAAMLRWHLREFVPDQGGHTLVFTDGKGPISRYRARTVLVGALRAAGLQTRSIDFRQLRHTAASLMLLAGVNPVDVQYRMGHAKYSTTANVYTHLMPKVIDEGTARIEALMRGEREA